MQYFTIIILQRFKYKKQLV